MNSYPLFCLTLSLLLWCHIPVAFAGAELGSKEKPLKISLVPGQDAGILQSEGEVLARFLEKETGLHFKVYVPFNFITVVETLGSSRTDIAMINSFGYLIAHKRYGAEVALIGTFNGRAEYWGQFITAKPEIKTLKDIQGKKIAYVDPASTSGYILPSNLLHKMKVIPKEFIFAGKHDTVVTSVYTGQVDVGATFHSQIEKGEPQDARRLVKTQFPDVFTKVRIIEIIGPIPSDPVIFRKDLPAPIRKKVTAAFLKFAKSVDGPKTLKALYNITGFQKVTDKDYNSLRKMIQDSGKTPEDFFK